MTPLDTALARYLADDNEASQYYDLVLNSTFHIPTFDAEPAEGTNRVEENDAISPVILESDGKSYLMLFDSEERLTAWAKQAVTFVVLPGYAIAEMTTPELHWAVNVGTDYSKEFVPDEIAWLQDVVRQCHEAEARKK